MQIWWDLQRDETGVDFKLLSGFCGSNGNFKNWKLPIQNEIRFQYSEKSTSLTRWNLSTRKPCELGFRSFYGQKFSPLFVGVNAAEKLSSSSSSEPLYLFNFPIFNIISKFICNKNFITQRGIMFSISFCNVTLERDFFTCAALNRQVFPPRKFFSFLFINKSVSFCGLFLSSASEAFTSGVEWASERCFRGC